ncbi:MFS transporter [Vibrio brasiliensis]|uniref:MFS transporter n=1 Tax=Vibrio brasiliensis TaxID=170652 RepID=UPI001EFC6649|nr:MFS transporter [Vibrio brasiliensis]MCG9726711.1 MFS transporter [Vibrio brasiliensis]
MRLVANNRTLPYLSGRFFDGISSGLFMMALPWIMLSTPDMGTFVAMVALACTATSFVLTPFFATLIDRRSRKALLIAVQVIQSLTAAIVLLAHIVNLDSQWLLAGAQMVFWVSSNLAWSTNNAFTQENYQRHEYASISGKQEIVMQTTTLGAGALGVILLQTWGMVEFAAFATFASALAALSYIVTPYNKQLRDSHSSSFIAQMKQSRAIFAQQPRFYAFLLLSCLSYPILTFLGKLVPIWFAENNISGDWYAGYNISFGLGSLLTGVLVSKLLSMSSHQTTMQYSMALVALALFGMSMATHPGYILLMTLVFGFFNALNRIARTNWMHHTIEISQRGRVEGGLVLFSTSVQSLSYVIIALLAHNGFTQYGFAIAAFTMLAAVVIMVLLNRSQPLQAQVAS